MPFQCSIDVLFITTVTKKSLVCMALASELASLVENNVGFSANMGGGDPCSGPCSFVPSEGPGLTGYHSELYSPVVNDISLFLSSLR